MPYYLTKYALSGGAAVLVNRYERYPGRKEDGWIWLEGYMRAFKLGRDVFDNRADAVKAIEAMRQKKIASVAKQLAALHRLRPEEMVPHEGIQP